MGAEARTLDVFGSLRVYLADHAKAYEGREQAILFKYPSWALTGTLTSATAKSNVDNSVNDIKNKELNYVPGSWRVVMTVIKNEKLLPWYIVSSQASTCLCLCLDLKILLKQTTKSGSHTTLKSGTLIGSVMAERWCMLKCMIKNLSEAVLVERLPACFYYAISILERNKQLFQDFPSCDHPRYMPVGSLYHPWDELPRQRLYAIMCAQCIKQCNKDHHCVC